MLAIVLALVALVFFVGSAVGAAWPEAVLGAADWGAVAAGAVDRGGAILSAIGAATARVLAWGWDRIAAIPWQTGLGALVDLAARFASVVGNLVGAAAGSVADLLRAVANRVSRLATTLTRTGSGEPVDPGRLAAYVAGWVVVVALLAWLLLRRLVHWWRGWWRCGGDGRARRGRRSSAART